MSRGAGRGGRTAAREGGVLSIGALSRATEIPVPTLRTWERRYGYPVPQRKPSGHRLYALDSVERLRRVAQAIARGHRASDVVAASEEGLARLLEQPGGAVPGARRRAGAGSVDVAQLLGCVERFDGVRLRRLLLQQRRRLAAIEWLETCVAPLVTEVGNAWAAGWLDVRHEHFLSEHVGDLLRGLRAQAEAAAPGPTIVLTTLPGEAHGLGLQMAALAFAVARCRTVYLGTETPTPDVVSSARELSAGAVGVSISSYSGGEATHRIVAELRRKLPPRVALAVGGAGAPAAAAGLTRIRSLAEIAAFARRLAQPA